MYALMICAATLIHAVWYAPESEVTVQSASMVSTATSSGIVSEPDFPDRLIIPALSINAHVQRVGLTAKGNMGIPTNFTDVAWYKYGTVPGKSGNALMDGHVDNGLSLPGVFKHLSDIHAGDDIYVVMTSGIKVHFLVTESTLYDYHSVPTDLIFAPLGPPRLRLITCEGSWVKSDKTYDQRLIVTAELRK